jgi:hypothetical protein
MMKEAPTRMKEAPVRKLSGYQVIGSRTCLFQYNKRIIREKRKLQVAVEC